jgi:hypothetical protein
MIDMGRYVSLILGSAEGSFLEQCTKDNLMATEIFDGWPKPLYCLEVVKKCVVVVRFVLFRFSFDQAEQEDAYLPQQNISGL